jgi:tetratricopeptide (TPR) repeat protein
VSIYKLLIYWNYVWDELIRVKETVLVALKLRPPTYGILSEFTGERGSKGNDLLNEGKYHAALNFFNASLGVYPKSVYFMYGKGLALAQLGKDEEAIESYNKVIGTSDKYLIGYFPTFEGLFQITCTAFIAKGVSLMILGNTIESIKVAHQFGEYLDAWPDRRYLRDYKGQGLEDYENFWLYRAKICIRRRDNVDKCLKNLEEAIICYKLGHRAREWQTFITRIKGDKDFENIVTDERFKAVIDKIPAFYDIFPSGIRKFDYDRVIVDLKRASDKIREGNIEEAKESLKWAVEVYKEKIGNPLFIINRLKQEKDFENIMNDECFKKFLNNNQM